MRCHRDRARRRLRANPRRSGVEAGGVQHPLRKFECQSPSPPRAAGAPSQRSMLTSCVLCARTSGFCRNWETSRSDEAVTAASTMSPVVGERRGGRQGGQVSHTSRPPAHRIRDLGGLKRVLEHTRERERQCVWVAGSRVIVTMTCWTSLHVGRSRSFWFRIMVCGAS